MPHNLSTERTQPTSTNHRAKRTHPGLGLIHALGPRTPHPNPPPQVGRGPERFDRPNYQAFLRLCRSPRIKTFRPSPGASWFGHVGNRVVREVFCADRSQSAGWFTGGWRHSCPDCADRSQFGGGQDRPNKANGRQWELRQTNPTQLRRGKGSEVSVQVG